MSWILFLQMVILLIILWVAIPTLYATISDKRYADALRRKTAGVFHDE